MEDEDFEVDDILNRKEPAKKKNSKDKGTRGERELCKILMKRFPGQNFSRVVGSGAHGGYANLTEMAKKVLSGDISAPENFRFCIEVKHGYGIELCMAFEKSVPLLDGFIKQATIDSNRVGKKPLLCWKKDRQPWLAFLCATDTTTGDFCNIPVMDYYTESGEVWQIVALSNLLKLPDERFFANGNNSGPN